MFVCFFLLGVNVCVPCTTTVLFRSMVPDLFPLKVKAFFASRRLTIFGNRVVPAGFWSRLDLALISFFPPIHPWQEILVIERLPVKFNHAQYALMEIWIGQYHRDSSLWVVPRTPLNERLPMGSHHVTDEMKDICNHRFLRLAHHKKMLVFVFFFSLWCDFLLNQRFQWEDVTLPRDLSPPLVEIIVFFKVIWAWPGRLAFCRGMVWGKHLTRACDFVGVLKVTFLGCTEGSLA